MKKWIYVIIPGSLLGLFIIFYLQDLNRLQEAQKQHDEAAAKQQAEDEDHRKALQEKARKESEQHEAEQKEAARKAAEEKAARWNAENDRIRGIIDNTNAKIAVIVEHINSLQAEKDALNQRKEQDIRDEFQLTRDVEQARVDQENAATENQRMVQMIAKAADDSVLTYVPPLPQAPKD